MSLVYQGYTANISQRFVNTIKGWEIINTPQFMFHGCRENDQGVDRKNNHLSGNKWFSPDEKYAGEYAWWATRDHTSTPLCAKIELRSAVRAVMRPHMSYEQWSGLIFSCFLDAPRNYELSRFIQDIMGPHLLSAFSGEVGAFMSCEGKEVLLPSCEAFETQVAFYQLPTTKEEYLKLFNE